MNTLYKPVTIETVEQAEARLQAVRGVLEFHGPEHAPENEADVHEDCGFRIVAALHRALAGDA